MKTTVLKIKNKLWVHENGRTYSLPLSLKTGAAQSDATANELVAPFTCKVLKVLVKPGDKIKQGQNVVTVEAMKMEYAYTSPRNGEISRVLVEPGKIVQEGTHFVEWKK